MLASQQEKPDLFPDRKVVEPAPYALSLRDEREDEKGRNRHDQVWHYDCAKFLLQIAPRFVTRAEELKQETGDEEEVGFVDKGYPEFD